VGLLSAEPSHHSASLRSIRRGGGGTLAATRAVSDAGAVMAKEYRRGLATTAINWWFERLTRLGVGASYRHILTVPGRRTGQPRSTPVDVIELNRHRWLVAGYGPANWVLNARASGEVKLSRGGQTERYKIAEATAEEAVPVLRQYIDEIRVTRPYFDASPSSSDAAVAAELPRHPVFRLIPVA
jgi:deazaflavin-dependent oxidoreductase (nitroreductase family)